MPHVDLILVSLICNDVSSLMDLSKKILSDPVNRWVFSGPEAGAFLVGGYVRDMLLNTISKDKDFALTGRTRETALGCSKKFKGTFIELKKDRTYRVVINKKQFIDFSCIDKTILDDLGHRDFTINAMAWSPRTGIIDPFEGRKDLQNMKLRVVDSVNLLEDPLRIIRAYRIAAQLGFELDKNTRKYLKKYAKEIRKPSPERTTEEIFKLLNNDKAVNYLELCNEDRVLGNIFGPTPSKLKEALGLIKDFDRIMINLAADPDHNKIIVYLRTEVGQGLKTAGFIRLALLLLNSSRNKLDDGLKFLRISRLTRKKITHIMNGDKLSEKRITERKLFEIFSESSECALEMALIMSLKRKRFMSRYINRADEYNKIKEKHLLTGDEIQQIINSGPGRIIGDIQGMIKEREFLGSIKNRRQAMNWIISNLT